MKYAVVKTKRFRKSLKKMLRRGKDIGKLEAVVQILASGEPLPPQYHDHALVNDLAGLRDCHIESDWLLVYQIKADVLCLYLMRTGTHEDLFEHE